jgi:hypothetical protein
MQSLRLREILNLPAAAAILLFAGGIPSAHAGYIVNSAATTNTGFGVIADACYNSCLGGTGADFFTALSGQPGAVASATGTLDTTGLLFTSNDLAFQSDPDTGIGVQSGSGFGAASLPFGTLKVATVTNGGGVGSTGLGSFSDVVNYSPPGATPSTVTDVQLQWTLDGTIMDTAPGGGSITWDMQFGNAGLNAIIYVGSDSASACAPGATPFVPCIEGGAPTVAGCVSSSFSSDTPGNIIFNCTYQLVGASFNIPVSGELYSDFGGGGTGQVGPTNVDFSHTAVYSLTVPDGTFTSDSGVFLTQQNTAAPEPGTLTLLALALSCVLAKIVAIEKGRRKTVARS